VTIAVNARRLAGQRLGVGRYIEYLVRYWDQMLEGDEQVVLYSEEPVDLHELELSNSISSAVLRPKLHGFVWENAVLPLTARKSDVLFAPSYMLPLGYRGKSVVAIHSMNEVWSGTHPWWYRYSYSAIYRASARRATRVIVPSRSTAEDIQEHYDVAAEKIDVIPQGADDIFRPIDDEDVLVETRRRWLGDDRPYVVFVGKLSQRRNIPLLIEAFASVKKRDGIPHALLLFGPNHQTLSIEQLAREHGVEDSVVQTDGRVDNHEDVVAVYSAADAYVSASSYEGFSLTMCEAMASGAPVVAVDRAAQREIVDGAGVLVDDATVEALADGIGRVLGSEKLRRDLRERGLTRARQFRLEETARQTLQVLREVAAA
jgi:glycosyltransferase involved in cell wall biosynthesis